MSMTEFKTGAGLLADMQGYQIRLRQVTQADLSQLRSWRNDPEISQYMLSQKPISMEQQQAWFRKIARDPRQQHFVIEYKGKPIGSANISLKVGDSLTDASVIEPGLYIADSRYRGNLLAFAPTLLLNDYCFLQLSASSLYAKVKASNQAALNYNQKLGYQRKQSNKLMAKPLDDELIEIELQPTTYQAHSAMLKGLLSRS